MVAYSISERALDHLWQINNIIIFWEKLISKHDHWIKFVGKMIGVQQGQVKVAWIYWNNSETEGKQD